MIIVKLQGGLGNQLFQYSLGRHLAMLNNVELLLDVSIYDLHKNREYELHHFNINAKVATPHDLKKFPFKTLSRKQLIKNWFIEKLTNHYLKLENGLNYNSHILYSSKNSYLVGFWQSEKYFKLIEHTIRSDLTFKKPLDKKNLEIANLITKTNSVSIHVRRGDYVSNNNANQILGALSLDYYEQAVETITNNCKSPHFFVFSDDPDWTVTNIKFNHPVTFVLNNDVSNGYKDIQLMSLCQHNIIANSSFSWWGAWLNMNKNKLVIAPKRWYNDLSVNSQTEDLIPNCWIRI